MTAEVLSISGEKQEKMELPDNLFLQKSNPGLVWEAVNNFLANQRQGTAKTKTKGEVSGGGRKPWRQKHTGRARHGSIRSPIWVGGGIVFGPTPRSYSFQIPKKKRRKALLIALSEKLNSNNLKVVSDIPKDINKTKEMAKILGGLGLSKGRTLILLDTISENLIRSTRNIPNLALKCARDLNVYDVVSSEQILFSKTGLEQFIADIGSKLSKEKVRTN
jgi:large subunit ribosomal protein L4